MRRKTYGVTLLCILIQNEARTDLQTKCCGTVPRLNVDKNVRFPVFHEFAMASKLTIVVIITYYNQPQDLLMNVVAIPVFPQRPVRPIL